MIKTTTDTRKPSQLALVNVSIRVLIQSRVPTAKNSFCIFFSVIT